MIFKEILKEFLRQYRSQQRHMEYIHKKNQRLIEEHEERRQIIRSRINMTKVKTDLSAFDALLYTEDLEERKEILCSVFLDVIKDLKGKDLAPCLLECRLEKWYDGITFNFFIPFERRDENERINRDTQYI